VQVLANYFETPANAPVLFVGAFVWPLLSFCAQTYGSAISSPSNSSGVATFDSIGLFDLPDGAVFQVFVVV
jgi:hypothetical protein